MVFCYCGPNCYNDNNTGRWQEWPSSPSPHPLPCDFARPSHCMWSTRPCLVRWGPAMDLCRSVGWGKSEGVPVPSLQQVCVPPLVSGLLPSPWEECAQARFRFWKRCVVFGTGLSLPTPPVLATLGSHRCGADLHPAQPGWTDCPETLGSPTDLWDKHMST